MVQIYRSDLDYTFKTDRKLLPKWSPPQRIHSRNLNSYTLEKLDGTPIAGQFSARRLQAFIPKRGSKLEKEQAERDERTSTEEVSSIQDDNGQEVPEDNTSGEGLRDDRRGVERPPSGEDATTQEGGHME